MILKIMFILFLVIIGICIIAVGLSSDDKHYKDSQKQNKR